MPLEAKRSLFQIVEYLKTQRNEKGELIEISDTDENKKSKRSQEERKERNINDRVRRHFDKSIEIQIILTNKSNGWGDYSDISIE